MCAEFGVVKPRRPKDAWTCPNDRQLALRAKLRSGWSVKTNTLNVYPKPPPISEREQQMIVAVVRKAEELDISEQHRVGKLVDRLESLKKIASGNGVTECILCGDTFGLAVFGRSNYKCNDCKKAVCRKCVVELGVKDATLRICKLCSEKRELIKKSGAWFYKAMPQHILPEKKNHYTNSYEKYAASPRCQEQKYVSRYIQNAIPSSPKTTSDGITVPPSTAGPSTSSSSRRSGGFFWSKSLVNRSQSEHENESSSGDEGAAFLSNRQHNAQLANPVEGLQISGTGKICKSGSGGNNSASGISIPVSRETSPTPFVSRRGQKGWSRNVSPTPGCSSTDEQPHPNHDFAGTHLTSGRNSLTSTSGRNSLTSSAFDLSLRRKSTERVDINGGPSEQQHGVGGSNNGDNNPKSSGSSSNDCLYQSNSTASNSTSSAAIATQQSSSPLGIIEVALLYDDSHQALHCSVHHAKDLIPMDNNGLADSYCILKLIPSRFEGTHLRTKTINKSVNPIYNETLTFYGVTLHDLTWQTLQILVMDDDRWGKDCLGTTQIPLHRLRSQQTRYFAQSLERGRLSEEREWGRGRLLLSLTYMSEKSLLLVGVIQAQDLPALDHNGTSDPFVKVRLLHDSNLGTLSTSCFSINRKFRTSVKWRTLNPDFREEFSLKVSIVDLPRLALVISVWDKDLGKNDDYIGGIVLSTGSKGDRLKHWLDMIKLPNTKHFKWHTLSPSLLPNH